MVLCIGMVLSAEAMNTAVEQLADALHPEHAERIRLVKDVVAGAVLITAIVSVVVAVLVIGKHLWQGSGDPRNREQASCLFESQASLRFSSYARYHWKPVLPHLIAVPRSVHRSYV